MFFRKSQIPLNFLFFSEKIQTFFQYAGWCPQNQDNYAAVRIKSIQNFKSDSLVHLERALIDIFPAVSFEIADL